MGGEGGWVYVVLPLELLAEQVCLLLDLETEIPDLWDLASWVRLLAGGASLTGPPALTGCHMSPWSLPHWYYPQ
jgi:hypothetical protein